MPNSLELLDQALALGRKELDILSTGEVEGTEESSRERGLLINRAWELREGADLDEFQRKLLQLQALQGELSDRAHSLHASLKADMKQTRNQGKRMAGYGQTARASRITPLGNTSRFLSRHG